MFLSYINNTAKKPKNLRIADNYYNIKMRKTYFLFMRAFLLN